MSIYAENEKLHPVAAEIQDVWNSVFYLGCDEHHPHSQYLNNLT
jgi:hypothetical protein